MPRMPVLQSGHQAPVERDQAWGTPENKEQNNRNQVTNVSLLDQG